MVMEQQTILIVDDSKTNAKILASLLANRGRLLFALSGADALAMINKDAPDLVLLDIVMPGMSGYEVCQKLKSDPKTQDIPVVFVTSLNDEEDEEEGLRLGAIDFIVKPFKPAIVKARVANILKLQATSQALRTANSELMRLATTDPLTGAANRRHFLEVARVEMERSQRNQKSTGVLMADIDHFKSINDTYGHDQGDVALIESVKIMQKTLRTADVLGRLGGEEFAVFLPETDVQGSLMLAERLRQAVASLQISTDKGRMNFTCSFGVYVIEQGQESIEAGLKKADEALYKSKAAGRNRVTLYAAPS